MCRHSCPAAEAEHRETVTPWGMMRLFEFAKSGDVEPSQDVAETFYHCMGCRRCQEWCLHDNDVPSALWSARSWMQDEGYVPEPLEGFAEEFLENNAPQRELPPLEEIHGFSRDQVFDQTATTVYVPDCETRFQTPDSVLRAGLLLEIFQGSKVALHTRRELDGRGVGFGCCGFPLLSVGDDEGYEQYRADMEAALMDADTVVTDCPAMVALYRDDTSWGESGDIEVVHLIEFLAERIDFVEPRETVELGDAMIHDSCFTGRQLDLYEEVRTLLDVLCEESPEEFHITKDESPCCGGPSHYHAVAPEASERCAEDRLEEMEKEGGEQIVATSATCKKAFRRADDDEAAIDVLDVACRAFGL
jgi:Fe-S oxidoreductase